MYSFFGFFFSWSFDWLGPHTQQISMTLYCIMWWHFVFYSFCSRSANYHQASGVCELSEMDRITLAGTQSFQPTDGKFIFQPYYSHSGGSTQNSLFMVMAIYYRLEFGHMNFQYAIAWRNSKCMGLFLLWHRVGRSTVAIFLSLYNFLLNAYQRFCPFLICLPFFSLRIYIFNRMESTHTQLLTGGHAISIKGSDYLENNCAEEPNKLCEFKRLAGRILKTVDSVYQDVSNVDECRELCLNSPYR